MGHTYTRFPDRRVAGRSLAYELAEFAAQDPVVIGLPRGGVPVAFEVAEALAAPLDVFGARKLRSASNPEYAIGAVAQDGTAIVDERAAIATGLDPRRSDLGAASESKDVAERADFYRGGKPLFAIEDRIVVLVDDGLATGLTDLVAIRALRRLGPRQIILAVPVAPAQSIAQIAAEADDVVCLLIPAQFESVGRWYDDFRPVSDDEVVDLLQRAREA